MSSSLRENFPVASAHADFSQLDLTPDNLAVVEGLFAQWLAEPASVDTSWHPIFEAVRRQAAGGNGKAAAAATVSGAPSFRPRSIFNAHVERAVAGPSARPGAAPEEPTELDSGVVGKVATLIAFYRLHGHLSAQIDPLGQEAREVELPPALAEGFTEEELAADVRCGLLFEEGHATVARIVERLERTYTRSIGVEYMHIPQADRRRWLQQRMEWTENEPSFTPEEKLQILRKLTHGDALEQFLHTKYVGMKRFSILGGEGLLPALDALIESAADHGVREIVIGMAHRGRLAVLASVLQKSAQEIFSEFERNPDPRSTLGIGDVKYHMGFSHDHVSRSGERVHLSLAFNPSHLEAVNPVVLGRVRAKEDRIGDRERLRGMGVLLHGDAAFAGQGLVAETLQLSQIPGYSSGGAMHIVINNQIGFTTNPWESRSTTYATDVAHMLEIPIFHVNGNDVEALVHVMRLAMDYRQAFHTDVVIDLVCFRRYGHNEGDEPRFTQPKMYALIEQQHSVRELYEKQLLAEGVIDRAQAEALVEQYIEDFSRSLAEVRAEPRRRPISQLRGVWSGYRGGAFVADEVVETSITRERLQQVAERLATLPEGFEPHRTIARLLNQRRSMGYGQHPIDWGMGESLAFGSLLLEGHGVRVSGQDSLRGTFGHRHAAVYDMRTGERFVPLQHLAENQGRFQCYNSMLSEAAVLGFDYGYSLDSPESLVIWEAQFGDFANNAQVILDQFIASGEAKWSRMSGLVLLLPHGYEGQGPEHSSARLERFLQLCAMDNMLVANVTTPAQFFHLLRRQVLGTLRKPLVVMSPKSLLRHQGAVSTIDDFTSGRFELVLPETRAEIDPSAVRRVLLCSGKIYYDLVAEAARRERRDVAIVRVEQLHPLPEAALREAVNRFPNRTSLVWVQEEPRNMGAWHYMLPQLIELFGPESLPEFVGRMASASPATGSPESHALEQEMILEAAFA